MPLSAPEVDPNPSANRLLLDKIRKLSFIALAILLAIFVILSWQTQDAMSYRKETLEKIATQNTLVEPWQTAVDLAATAVSAEEHQYARTAQMLADHEVHQAFQQALSQAELDVQKRSHQPEALRLTKVVEQRQQTVAQDQATVKSLSLTTTPSTDADDSSVSNDLDLATAQLQLDTDQLKDAQQALALNLGDERGQLEQELSAHEAAVKKLEADSASRSLSAVATTRSYGTLYRRLTAWFEQNSRYQSILQASSQARSFAARLNAAPASKPVVMGQSASKTDRMDAMKRSSMHRQMQMISSTRVQDLTRLEETYQKWANQVQIQHRIVFHLLMQSLAYLALILLVTLLLDTFIHYLFNEANFAKSKLGQHLYRLKLLAELAIHAIAAVGIFILLFGPPSELSTIVGLATAGLTVVLQDFIISFFGWFVLMGKHGVRLGDWIEINGIAGEVADIGIFRTALLETGNWTDHGLPTGRRITFPNSFAIRGQYFNFTTSGQWTWDELIVTVPATDAYGTVELIHRAVLEETMKESDQAEDEWKRSGRSSGLSHLSAEAAVNMRPSSGGVDIVVRYVTRAAKRYQMRNVLNQKVLEVIHKPALAQEGLSAR